ncbi:hypothetical protein [Streptomyces syringium]|uniref:hypothetical protein n=1 Tax=Streptomyces syringium TaxID=76729 RepID=UPI00341CE6FF
MKARALNFVLYADERGMEWVKQITKSAARERGTRVVTWQQAWTSDAGSEPPDDAFDFLAQQWAYEHPGEAPDGRRLVELRVGVVCSLRVWRALRKTVLRKMCPEEDAPHACQVPWIAM